MIDEEKAKAEAAAEEDTKATLERLDVSMLGLSRLNICFTQ